MFVHNLARDKRMKPINPDNVFGSAGDKDTFSLSGPRDPNQNRPTKGKTARKRKFPPSGHKTNIGDPMKGQSSGGRKKG
jgi:hypothetical protein